LIKVNPEITRRELAENIGLTEDGIKYHLKKMQEKGILKRVALIKAGTGKLKKSQKFQN